MYFTNMVIPKAANTGAACFKGDQRTAILA